MKIAEVRTHAGYSTEFERNVTLVQVVTDSGLEGWGDCGLSGKERATVECVHEFRDWLVGQDAFRSEHIWQDLFRGSFWRAAR